LCKTLLPLKLLVDTDDWPFFGKTQLIFSAHPLFKKRSRATERDSVEHATKFALVVFLGKAFKEMTAPLNI